MCGFLKKRKIEDSDLPPKFVEAMLVVGQAAKEAADRLDAAESPELKAQLEAAERLKHGKAKG